MHLRINALVQVGMFDKVILDNKIVVMYRKQILNLDKLTSEEAYDLIDSITDDQAFDSDLGGDSDAEDDLPQFSSPSSSTPRTLKRRFAKIDDCLDFDSDDSVADPDFDAITANRTYPNHDITTLDYNDSSDDDDRCLW
ncbi:hypothetical protein FQA39_LY05250 [Lamprigera yunnana]|nr:hypothetical protein FQA39_LY05250 [Lamprigera yunnana]